FAEAWGNLALLYDRIGKISEARKAFDKAYKLQPDLCNLAINLGCFELNHGNPEAALRAIKAGLEYYPENPRLKELFEAAGKNRDENYN
ncbi:MAG: tetratricopeptide repeat protein, partial [Fibrobacter sp.]|nr:tetratricopeptide repeat protein [Fibrobacter sp.]